MYNKLSPTLEMKMTDIYYFPQFLGIMNSEQLSQAGSSFCFLSNSLARAGVIRRLGFMVTHSPGAAWASSQHGCQLSAERRQRWKPEGLLWPSLRSYMIVSTKFYLGLYRSALFVMRRHFIRHEWMISKRWESLRITSMTSICIFIFLLAWGFDLPFSVFIWKWGC